MKRSRLAEIESLRQGAPPIPYAMAASEGGAKGTRYEGFHDAPIHLRGSYDRLGETVPRRMPRVLAGEDQPPITGPAAWRWPAGSLRRRILSPRG